MTKGFVENGFIIDLGNAKDASDIIYELSSILEMPEAQYRQICLKLGNIDLTQSQLLSIKSLITSLNSELAFVDTNSNQTELAALNLGLIVSKLSNEIEVVEDEQVQDYLFEDNSHEAVSENLYEKIEPEQVEEKIEVIEKTDEELQAEDKLEELIDEENEQDKQKEESEHEVSKMSTLYLQQTLRSGQTISYDGNIVLIGDAHPGSEIIAKGDITVWGILGGIAHAGARGNDWAKIRALKINAIQLRISGFYARRPDSLNIPFIQKTSQFTPEEAKVNEHGEIIIYKLYSE
ncbi:MAG TPA: septum site-determining protein MinC [Candidatus Gastranaerophilaceae bacterium]|nr:septum site-determining protein MinC [Candidatus Gastranaerophilaceae bacterium]HPT41559.1 septum site-determining protein MinC [Candidatus Gastranaerophilaceae bacterium]